jgi:prenyltransferase beta subunit
MKTYINKIKNSIKNDGIGKTVYHICRVGAQRATILQTRREIKNVLPERIEEVRAAFLKNPQRYLCKVKIDTLAYVKSIHKPAINIGAYAYKTGGLPILYASCYAAMTRHLCNDLDDLRESERKEWIAYIQSYQKDDGIFRDPVIDIPLAAEIDWWGWRHMTLHVLMALTALGGIAEKQFNLIKPFEKKGYMNEWLSLRNWKIDPASVSNEVQNYATVLQYARDFQNEAWCDNPLQEMYTWLDKTQDTETGLWGARFNDPVRLSNGVQTGYHIWLLYFYDKRPVQYIERIIDSCLMTQNPYGGFGVALNSSACEDIDSIDPLVRLSFQTDYRKEEVEKALQKAFPWILVNFNSDGGWVFRRYDAFEYGHPVMRAEREESTMFPTWFRTLTLAYLEQALSGSYMLAPNRQFIEAPGHQFGILK